MDESAFLAAIVADPGEDGPRLVYADWLLERGDERGELIQLSCRAREDVDAARESGLLTRLEDLLQRRPELFDDLEGYADEWDRGLPSGVHMSADEFLRDGPRIFERAPITSLWLDRLNRAKSVADHPLLERVRRLRFSGRTERVADMSTILRSRHLAGLRTLRFDLVKVGLGVFSTIADAQWSLESLEVVACQLPSSNWLQTIQRGDGIRRLRRLELAGNRSLGNWAVPALELVAEWAPLEVLDIRGTNIDRGALAGLDPAVKIVS